MAASSPSRCVVSPPHPAFTPKPPALGLPEGRAQVGGAWANCTPGFAQRGDGTGSWWHFGTGDPVLGLAQPHLVMLCLLVVALPPEMRDCHLLVPASIDARWDQGCGRVPADEENCCRAES